MCKLTFAAMLVFGAGCGRQSPADRTPHPNDQSMAPAGSVPAEVKAENAAIVADDVQAWIGNAGLRRLRVAGSSINDAALALVAQNCKLELLDISGCEQLTPVGIAALSTLTTLRNLKVSGAAVNDDSVPSLKALTHLAALSLQQTAVTDNGIAIVAALPELKELTLMATPVTDACLASIASLTQLQKLRLRGTQVTGRDAAAFGQMKSVVDLDLSETSFESAGLASIATMPNLKMLNLWLTKVDDEGIAALTAKTQLKQLNLDNVKGVTDQSLEVISQMVDLELLHLGGTSVSAAGLPKLYGLKNLRTLFITRLELSPEDVEALRKAMPWLTKLES